MYFYFFYVPLLTLLCCLFIRVDPPHRIRACLSLSDSHMRPPTPIYSSFFTDMQRFNKLLDHSSFRRAATALPRATRHALAFYTSSASSKTQALGRSTSTAATSVACLATPLAVQALSAPAPMGRVAMAAFSASAASATSEASGSSDALPLPGRGKDPSLMDPYLDAAILEALTRMVAEKSAQANPGQKDPDLKEPSPDAAFFTRMVVKHPAQACYFLALVGVLCVAFLHNKIEATRTELRADMKEMSSKMDRVMALFVGARVLKNLENEDASLVAASNVAKVE